MHSDFQLHLKSKQTQTFSRTGWNRTVKRTELQTFIWDLICLLKKVEMKEVVLDIRYILAQQKITAPTLTNYCYWSKEFQIANDCIRLYTAPMLVCSKSTMSLSCQWAREVKAKSFISVESEINFCLRAVPPSRSPAMPLTSQATCVWQKIAWWRVCDPGRLASHCWYDTHSLEKWENLAVV